jgi:hypothetical protein
MFQARDFFDLAQEDAEHASVLLVHQRDHGSFVLVQSRQQGP